MEAGKGKRKKEEGRLCHAHQLYAFTTQVGSAKGIQVKLSRPSGNSHNEIHR